MSYKRFTIPFSVLLTAILLLPAGGNSSGRANTAAVRGQDLISAAAPGHLMVIENIDQWPEDARFQVWGGAQTLWLAEDAIWITVIGRGEASPEDLAADQLPWTDERFLLKQESPGMPRPYTAGINLRLSFPGANPHPCLEPFDRLDTHVSYFIGTDPEKWRPDIPVWGGVRYRDLYPGVDLELTGTGAQWQWRLVASTPSPVATGDPGTGSGLTGAGRGEGVTLRVEGADAVALKGAALRVTTALGEFALPLLQVERLPAVQPQVTAVLTRPDAFDVTAPFGPTTGGGFGHPLASDAAYPLRYATFLGGSDYDRGNDIAVDSAGQAYITGTTDSLDFPAARGPGYDTTYNSRGDAFVVKLNAAGTSLRYATFLGGAWGSDYGYGIAVDSFGQAYVTGSTGSGDFPAARGPGYDTTYNGGGWGDAFVVKLDATGTALRYATFLGGSGDDQGVGITVDSAGQAYVAGSTESANFPASLGPGYDTTYNGGWYDAFVVKLDAAGAGLLYATFLGGGDEDRGGGIAVDSAGQAYVTGETWSSDFPANLGPGYDTTYNGGYRDAFVVKLDAGGASLLYATFIGGSSYDVGCEIALDSAAQAYVTGVTASTNFPAALGPGYDTTLNIGNNTYVVKLDATGTVVRYATFLGGSSDTDLHGGSSIALDGAGQAYVTGSTGSADFPADLGPGYDTTYNGGWYDAFVVKLDAAGTGLLYATFLGGSGNDVGNGIAVDSAGQAYVAGSTESANFPARFGPGDDTTFNGQYDAFVVKLDTAGTTVIAPRTGVLPALDGNPIEWQTLTPIHLDHNNASFILGETPTSSDLSAELRAAWAPDALYFAAAMADDVLVGNNSTQIWGDDVLELGLRVGSATHQFSLALDGRTTDNGYPITSLTYVTRTVPGGWTLEVAIPAVALGLTTLVANQQYPFTFGLWDDDLFTYPGQTHMIWQGTSTNTYQPEWGTLSLSGTVYDFPQQPDLHADRHADCDLDAHTDAARKHPRPRRRRPLHQRKHRRHDTHGHADHD